MNYTFAQLKEAISSFTDEMVVVHKDNQIIMVNEAFCRVAGYTEDQTIGRSPFDFIHEHDRYLSVQAIERGKEEPYLCRFISKNGPIVAECKAKYVTLEGEIARMGIAKDITSQLLRDQQIKNAVLYDNLTGLLNLKGLQEKLTEIWSQEHAVEHFLLVVSLDKLSLVRESGRIAQNQFIKQIARCINDLSANDCAARIETFEFALLVNGDIDNAIATAHRLVSSVEETEFKWGLKYYRVSCCVGIASTTTAHDPDRLLSNADAAGFIASQNPETRVVVYKDVAPIVEAMRQTPDVTEL
jgi:PAS domain S-box-containing protein/diguanylate cyclase (GGDEF)-like protein